MADKKKNIWKVVLAILFALLCILDNIFTYEITRWPIYQEVGPVALLMLSIPYGLWIQKAVVCLMLLYFRSKISNTFLGVITLLMFLIVCNNGYYYCRVLF
tara:strand:+ start:1689 stop:1991 length:303 start_codon:yes stop_codon:yes gene_type:complete